MLWPCYLSSFRTTLPQVLNLVARWRCKGLFLFFCHNWWSSFLSLLSPLFPPRPLVVFLLFNLELCSSCSNYELTRPQSLLSLTFAGYNWSVFYFCPCPTLSPKVTLLVIVMYLFSTCYILVTFWSFSYPQVDLFSLLLFHSSQVANPSLETLDFNLASF